MPFLFRRGLNAALPTNAQQGEPLWSTDTQQLYVGNGTATPKQILTAGNGLIVNADISGSAAISFGKLAALTSGNILVGNGSNVAASVAVTGDIALTNAGVTSYSGTVPVNKGGTNITSYAIGDMPYATGVTTLSKLTVGAVGTGMTSTGTAPQWQLAWEKCKATTENRTSTITLTADADLTFSPTWKATTQYIVEAYLVFLNAAGSISADIQWNGPANNYVNIGWTTFRLGGTTITINRDTAFVSGGTAGTTITLTAGIANYTFMKGAFQTTNSPGATAFELQWAQNSSSATSTQLLQGSWMRVYEC